VLDPFGLISTYAGGPSQLAAFGAGAVIQRDDAMALEYTGPRALNGSSREANARLLSALQDATRRTGGVAALVHAAGAEQWRQRGEMMLGADAFETAYTDFERALTLDSSDIAAAEGLVRAAGAVGRQDAARARLADLARAEPGASAPLIGLSKLHAGLGQYEEAVRAAVAACRTAGAPSRAFEQLASVYADAGDAEGLAMVVEAMRALFPRARATAYYDAALRFMQGDMPAAQQLAERAAAADAAYAPAHNLRGAIYASAGDVPRAREAFREALALDPRDSSVYTNLGRLEAGAGGDAGVAARLFAEALTLDPGLEPAREGLAAIKRQTRK
jgi:Flp pilus assembly protein TadD